MEEEASNMIKFIDTGAPLTDSQKSVKIPVGNYVGFLLRCTGVSNSGKTMLNTSIGNVQLIKSDEMIQNVDFEFLHLLTNLKGGFAESSAIGGGAFSFTTLIPVMLPQFPNSLDVQNTNDARFEFQWDITDIGFASATTNASATWRLYGILSNSQTEKYILKVHTQDLVASATGQYPQRITGQNTSVMYMREENSAVVDNITVNVDGEVLVNTNEPILTAFTNIVNRIESAGTLIEIQVADGTFEDAISNEVEIIADFGTAGTLAIWKLGMDFAKASPATSAIRASAKASQKVLLASPATRASLTEVAKVQAIRAGSSGAVSVNAGGAGRARRARGL